jgi:Arc/MetJ-type ribon-helix-helix transcriptional regulator
MGDTAKPGKKEDEVKRPPTPEELPQPEELDDEEGSLADEADELFEEQGGDPERAGEGKGEAGLEKLQFPLNVVESEEDKRTAKLQDFLIQKLERVYLPIEGKDEAYMTDLLERMKKERSGEVNKTNPGHPEFGAATKELFAAYKNNLENRQLKSVMTELSTMDLGSPSLSPERLRMENHAGKMLPETPASFLARMRRGDTEFKLQTAESGKMVDVDTNKLPTDDVFKRIQSAEDFMTWANDKVILDRKLRYHENLLEERIKKEGWPKEWLESPMKQTNRAGWCMAVMERMTDSTSMARSIESLYAMRTKQGMANYGDEALKNLPKHVHVETEKRDGKEYVKRVTFDQPLDLDLRNPDFLKNRQGEVNWQTKHGREIDKLVMKSDMAHANIKNWLFQGDIKVPGMQVIVDKKTNEILGMHKKDVLKDPAKMEMILQEAGKKRSDVTIEDADMMRCRINAGEERGESGELKFVTIDYGVQYGLTPPINYHNLFMSPIGKPSRPSAEGEADGLQRFKPDEIVIGRDGHGEDKPMPAKDVALYAQCEDLKRALDVGVSVVMDASMILGVGAAFQGVRLVRAAHGAMDLIRAGQAGMAVANGVASKEMAAVGYRMIRHGVKDFALGASAFINNDTVQQYRGYYFLGHAASGLPGVNRITGAIAGRFGGARDVETLKSLKDAALADGKTLKEVRSLGLSEGAFYSATKPLAEKGFKYSNYAFAGILSHELWKQSEFINGIGSADGFAIAKDRMKGVDTQGKKRTPEEERVRQDEVHRTASRILEDYSKSTTGNGAEVKSIADRTKALLEPPPKELKGAELDAWNAKRKADIEQFQKDLRANYLQFDGKRVADLERQRAEKTPSNATDVGKLQDDPVYVQSVKLEGDKLAAAVEAYRAKEEEYKKLGEAKDDAERAQRRDDLAKLKFQKEFAQDRYDSAASGQTLAVRGLETSDPKLDNGAPERKFADRLDAQKAAALAYMLLYSADGKELPADGVLAKDSMTIPGWKVEKTWQESNGETSVTRSATIEGKERKIDQKLTVDDLTKLLNPDMSAEVSAMKRITTAEALDRLRMIPPEIHASVLKRIALDPRADPKDRSRAVADLGAVVVQLELDEARRMTSGVPMSAQLAAAGDRFGNTSKDLKEVLAKIASDSNEKQQDVRAMATYMSYALDKRSSKWDDSDRDFFEKTILQNPPTMSYDQLLGYLKPLAGMQHGDKMSQNLDEKDLAGWERRARALVALEKLCNPKDGYAPNAGFSQKEINERLAQCAHPSRPATTAFVMNAMLDNVRQDGVPRTRLEQFTLDNPRAAMDFRRKSLDLLKTSFGGDVKNDPNARAEVTARIQLMEQLPEFLKSKEIPEAFKAELQGMRQEAGRVLKATLCAADEMEVRFMRAALRDVLSTPNASKEKIAEAQAAVDKAERDMILAKGCQLNPDSPQVIELSAKMRAAKDNPEELKRLKDEWINSWGVSLYGPQKLDASGKPLPDLSMLNGIAYEDAEMRKAAIRALGEFGAGDEDSRRILIERATPPKNEALSECRFENVADVRLAALNALQKSMAPLSFSRLCNSLVEKEPSPGVATKMRMNTWYSDIALDPQSVGYQDLSDRATEFIKPFKNLDEIKARYHSETGGHYWLSGQKLGADLAKAADQYNWLTAGVTNLFSDTRVKTKEREALLDTYKTYREKINTDIIAKFTKGDAEGRKFAREMCFGILAAPPEGFNDNAATKKSQDDNAYSNQRLYASKEILHDIQMQAAKALSEACKAGNPERDQTAAYIIQSLKMTTDYAVKRELLKGLTHLSSNKVGGATDKTESETLAFDPGVGSKFVLDAITDSIGDSAQNPQKSQFQLECANYLRQVMTSDVMRKTNIYAELEGKANHKDCPSALRHALLDIIADRRDRVMPVWGACRVDSVNATVEDRMQLLREAAADVKPGLLEGTPAQPAANGSELEARVPSAVYKIFAAAKDSSIPLGDPRIDALKALASGNVKPGERQTDERVRLAAAFALYKTGSNFETAKQSLDAIVDVAVNGNRPGVRRDAMDIIANMKGDYLREAERLLNASRAKTEDASGQPYPKKDVDMAEAARLGMLGKVLVAQNRNKEAEAPLRAAYNLYLGKPVDTPLHTGANYPEEDARALSALRGDRRFREVADAVENLQRLRPDSHLAMSANWARYNAFGPNHPESVNAHFNSGLQQKKYALERQQKEGISGFVDLFNARKEFVSAFNGAVSGFYPMPLDVRLKSLDEIGDISLRLAPMEHPLEIAIGYVPAGYKDAAYDLDRAQRAYNQSLEMKEKYKVGAADLAQAHFNLARVAEMKAKLLPGQQESGMTTARAEVDKALQIARGAKDNLVLSDQLRNAAQFYKRNGDAQKSAQYEKEALDIVEKRVGKGSLGDKTAEQVEETIASFKASLGADHPVVAKLLTDASTRYLQLGKLDMAEKHADSALAIYKAKPPEDASTVIDALNARHNAVFRYRTNEKNASCVDSLTWLKTLQEGQAKGENTPALQRTRANLSECLAARAGVNAEAGNTAAARSDFALLLANENVSKDQKLSEEAKARLAHVAQRLENQAYGLRNQNKFNEAGELFTFALSCRLQENGGKLPEKLEKQYKDLVNNYEGYLGGQLKALKNTGKMEDASRAIETWVQLSRQLNGGRVSDDVLKKLNIVHSEYANHINKTVPLDADYNAEKMRTAEPVFQSVLAAQRERLLVLKEQGRKDETVDMDLQIRELRVVNYALMKHYQSEKQFAKSDATSDRNIETARLVAPSSYETAGLVAQKMDNYLAQGKRELALAEVDKHIDKVADTLGTADGVAGVAELMRLASIVECNSKQPGVTADVAAKAIAALNRNVQKLPKDKQVEALNNLNAEVLNAMNGGINELEAFTRDPRFEKRTDAEKEQHKESIKRLLELKNQTHSAADGALKLSVEKWSSSLAGAGKEEPSQHLRDLIDNYCQSGRYAEGAKFVRDHIKTVMEKGTPEQAADALASQLRALSFSNATPEQIADISAGLCGDVIAMIDQMPEGKRDQMYSILGSEAARGMHNNVLSLRSPGFGENTDNAKREAAAKKLQEVYDRVAEKISPSLLKEIDKFEKGADKENPCKAFTAMFEMQVAQGKMKEANELAGRHMAALLSSGRLEQVNVLMRDIGGNFNSEDRASHGEFLLNAKSVLDKHLASVPQEQKQDVLARVAPLLSERMQTEARMVSAHDASASQKLQAGAKEVAITAKGALQARLSKAVAAKDDASIVDAYGSLTSAFVAMEDWAELQKSTEALVKSMNENGNTERATFTVQNVLMNALRNDSQSKVGPTALAALQMIETQVAKLDKAEDRSRQFRALAEAYDHFSSYVNDQEISKQMKERSANLKKRELAGSR